MTTRSFTTLENEWITLSDGTRLAARIWMPEDAEGEPVPAVLEYLPYRKRDGTCLRDESTYPVFASAGIAGVRVDIRGSGESDGVIDGEYTPRELSDACEVIAWIARQPWSNGNVGMMGISWGGFNCLQVAALHPPALKAVISIASTVDRYNDDIHYKNGCHLSAQLSWAGTMLGYQSRSPDPALVGDRWKDMWLERLENEPFFMEEWLAHQRRDDFWRHGSICEDFSGFTVPALVIAGWADGYRNTPFKAVEGVAGPVKALIGPWIHKYPHFAWPKPRTDFHSEAIAWWNHWLRGANNGAETMPEVRAYIQDGPKPSRWRAYDPGFWIAKDEWTRPAMHTLCVDVQGALAEAGQGCLQANGDHFIRSPLDTGTMSGEWFTLKPDAEIAQDQRLDDAGSLVFETAPLEEAVTYLGQPTLDLIVACDADSSNICARIVDIHPDGTATRVTFGVLNLAHRDGNGEPQKMEPGKKTKIRLVLDAMGYRFGPGHRIRLSLSTSYWPMVLPGPYDPGLTIDAGSLLLALPELGDHRRIEIPEPANPDPLPKYRELAPGTAVRRIERDMHKEITELKLIEDTGLFEHPETGLATRQLREEVWTIAANDPLSMTGTCTWTCDMQRPGWFVRTIATASLVCSETDWIISARVLALEGETQIFEKQFALTRIPRDFM